MRTGDEAEAEYHSPMSEADNYIIEFTQVGGSVKDETPFHVVVCVR